MYGLPENPSGLTKEELPFVSKELEASIRQIKNALLILNPKRHKAARICLGESLRIVEQGLAEIKKQIAVGRSAG